MGYRIEDAISDAVAFAGLPDPHGSDLLAELADLRAAAEEGKRYKAKAEKGERYIRAVEKLERMLHGRNNTWPLISVNGDGIIDAHTGHGSPSLPDRHPTLLAAIEAAKEE
jgi:hypothetical protein